MKTKDLVINASYGFSLIDASYFFSDFCSSNTIFHWRKPPKISDFPPLRNSANQKLNINCKKRLQLKEFLKTPVYELYCHCHVEKKYLCVHISAEKFFEFMTVVFKKSCHYITANLLVK